MKTKTNSPPAKTIKSPASAKKKRNFSSIISTTLIIAVILMFIGGIIVSFTHATLSIPISKFMIRLSMTIFLVPVTINSILTLKEVIVEKIKKPKPKKRKEKGRLLYGIFGTICFSPFLFFGTSSSLAALCDIINGPQETTIYNADVEEKWRRGIKRRYRDYYLIGTTLDNNFFHIEIENPGDVKKVREALEKSSCFEVSYFKAMRYLYDIETCK